MVTEVPSVTKVTNAAQLPCCKARQIYSRSVDFKMLYKLLSYFRHLNP